MMIESGCVMSSVAIEVGDAVENQGLAVEHEARLPDLARGRN
jgi:hypothetical protein